MQNGTISTKVDDCGTKDNDRAGCAGRACVYHLCTSF